MWKFFKQIYLFIPFKRHIYSIVKLIWSPNNKIAGYLKFDGIFKTTLFNKELKIQNKNLTIPTLLFWNGIKAYEPMTTFVWSVLSEKSEIIFDLGSNFGLFSLAAKLSNEKAKVYAFEPLKRNVELIEYNSYLNNFDIQIENIAISEFEGVSKFYDMDSYDNTIGSFDSSFVKRHKHHQKLIPIHVKTDTIDSFCKKNNISQINLMKIDVEGAEKMVINGSMGSILKYKPDIIIEFSDEASFVEIKSKLLKIANYKIYLIDEKSKKLIRYPVGKGETRNFLFTCKEVDKVLNMSFRDGL